MKVKGSITIYLSIILLSVILLISVMAEAARISVVQTQIESTSYMAADSVMAGYGKQIYDDYGVLLVWKKESVEEQMKKYIQANINMADLNTPGTNLMGTNLISVNIDKIEYVTEKGGENLVEQIISYMKYAEAAEAVDLLADRFNRYQKCSETEKSDNSDVTDIADKNSDELQDIVNEIKISVTKLKDMDKLSSKLSIVSQKIDEIKDNVRLGIKIKNVRKFLKEYRGLMTELDKKASDVNSVIDKIRTYERKKERFLKENDYTSGAGDYIDENLKILENIKDKIKMIKELNVSELSDIDSKNITSVIKTVENIKTVKGQLESLHIKQASEKDKESQSIYESAKEMLKKGILSLVIDDVSDISCAAISNSNLPTNLKKENNSNLYLEKIKSKAALALFSEKKFGNYTIPRKNAALEYGMEYVICGEYNDRDNLLQTVTKITLIRNAINAAYLITDRQKMSEISSTAFSAAAAVGLPFMEPIIKGVLVEAWSMAESVNDMRNLLKNQKVPIIKNKNNWKTSLKHLFSRQNSTENKQGIGYTGYCELLIMLQNNHDCIYRIMDMIQVNIQKKYNKDFLMCKCLVGIKSKINYKIQPLFIATPWSVNMLNNNQGGYNYCLQCSSEY